MGAVVGLVVGLVVAGLVTGVVAATTVVPVAPVVAVPGTELDVVTTSTGVDDVGDDDTSEPVEEVVELHDPSATSDATSDATAIGRRRWFGMATSLCRARRRSCPLADSCHPPLGSKTERGSVVVGVLAGGVIGEVAHTLDGRDVLDDHGLHAFQHRHAAHRAAVAATTHGEVGGALVVVAHVGDEPAVRGERRVHLGGDDGLDFDDCSAPVTALATHGGAPSKPDTASIKHPYMPAMAPRPTAAAYCTAGAKRASSRLDTQATSSHDKVAGKVPPVTSASRITQSVKVSAANATPTPAQSSTNSTARSTTPVWQASNTKAGSRPSTTVATGCEGVRSWNADNIWVSFMNPDFDSITSLAPHVQKPTR